MQSPSMVVSYLNPQTYIVLRLCMDGEKEMFMKHQKKIEVIQTRMEQKLNKTTHFNKKYPACQG